MARILTLVLTVAGLVVATVGPARGADKAAIEDSIKRARAFLKAQFHPALVPSVDVEAYQEGPAALAGIALLLAGEKPSDPAVQNIARRVRDASLKQDSTYHLSLDILFLDHLGEPVDTILIQSMAARLIKGQSGKAGGWEYRSAGINAAEQARVAAIFRAAKRPPGKPGAGSDAGPPKLDDGIKEMIERGTGLTFGPTTGSDDNSNTQFAVLALWSARKWGVPVDECLEDANKRFRNSHDSKGGGWGYKHDRVETNPAMTCAGLLALSAAYGRRLERSMRSGGHFEGGQYVKGKGTDSSAPPPKFSDFLKDPMIVGALNYLGGQLARDAKGGAASGDLSPLRDDLYFMWSLERVCVIYGLEKVGDIDWHDWGAKRLIATQHRDGRWFQPHKHYRNELVDTAFGLIFMSRGNIAKDLERIMRPPKKGDLFTGPGNKKPDDQRKGPPVTDPESVRLTKALVDAEPAKQRALIDEYKTSTGTAYTSALANAIPKLKEEFKTAVRNALAERLARFSAKTLAGYLDNDNAELARAACLAVAISDERSLIPALIERLDDTDELVWRAAAIALRDLSGGKDLGPKKGATDVERDKAIKAWRTWYETVEKKAAEKRGR